MNIQFNHNPLHQPKHYIIFKSKLLSIKLLVALLIKSLLPKNGPQHTSRDTSISLKVSLAYLCPNVIIMLEVNM